MYVYIYIYECVCDLFSSKGFPSRLSKLRLCRRIMEMLGYEFVPPWIAKRF